MSISVQNEIDKIMRLPAVMAASGYRRTSIFIMARKGTFPAPVRLGSGAIGWRQSDIAAWLASRPLVQLAPLPAPTPTETTTPRRGRPRKVTAAQG
ncbi:MAG: AlpA family phage regulatory protein [Magnetococcales bacterium]|nr:AlpA family phage regulatory protein [Magnetococcales bacterium]